MLFFIASQLLLSPDIVLLYELTHSNPNYLEISNFYTRHFVKYYSPNYLLHFGRLKGSLRLFIGFLSALWKEHVYAQATLLPLAMRPAPATLEVEFHSGSIYQYFRVPERVYNALMSARSHGSYFNDHVRDSYTTRQVR